VSLISVEVFFWRHSITKGLLAMPGCRRWSYMKLPYTTCMVLTADTAVIHSDWCSPPHPYQRASALASGCTILLNNCFNRPPRGGAQWTIDLTTACNERCGGHSQAGSIRIAVYEVALGASRQLVELQPLAALCYGFSSAPVLWNAEYDENNSNTKILTLQYVQ